VCATKSQSGVSEAGGQVFVPQTPGAFVHDDDGNLLSDGRWAYTWDGEKRLVSMTTHAREMSAEYEYGPFGEPLRATGPLAKANPVRFSSELLDTASGCYYYGYRYYNPDTGRWLSRDPIGELGGVNLYAVSHNMVNQVFDYLGLSVFEDIPKKLEYSCNCGWIDWGHAKPDNASSLINRIINKDGKRSKTGMGFYIRGEMTMGRTIFGKYFGLAAGDNYYVPLGLRPDEGIGVGLGIFKDYAMIFEKYQARFLPSQSSSFSEEDLPSDIISYYIAASNHGSMITRILDETVVRELCKVVDPDESKDIWRRDGGLGTNHNFTPVFHKTCSCTDTPKWPFTYIRESRRWRQWKAESDGSFQ
jgi:RHS repeat-associated protein